MTLKITHYLRVHPASWFTNPKLYFDGLPQGTKRFELRREFKAFNPMGRVRAYYFDSGSLTQFAPAPNDKFDVFVGLGADHGIAETKRRIKDYIENGIDMDFVDFND